MNECEFQCSIFDGVHKSGEVPFFPECSGCTNNSPSSSELNHPVHSSVYKSTTATGKSIISLARFPPHTETVIDFADVPSGLASPEGGSSPESLRENGQRMTRLLHQDSMTSKKLGLVKTQGKWYGKRYG